VFRHRAVRWIAANGTPLTMRLARAEDAPQLQVSLGKLSPEARRNRFFAPMPGFSDALVKKMTDVDPAREHVLMVMRRDDSTGRSLEFPVAGGRFVVINDAFTGQPTQCEFALVVGDQWQKQGIGRRIMQALIAEASRRGLQQMVGDILTGNRPMLELARSLGFAAEPGDDHTISHVVLNLPQRKRWATLLGR